MLNVSCIQGRFVADPELKTTDSGVSVISFTLAVDRDYVKQGEERQADFIDCVAWRGTAEFISKYFGKGDMIVISGSIQTRNYEDKNGNKRKSTEVVVEKANFCGSKRDSQSKTESYSESAAKESSTSENTTRDEYRELPDEDDLPF